MAKRIEQVEAAVLRKQRFWRTIPASFARTVLESGPSFSKGSRYTVRGEFGGVYFSASKDLCEFEHRQATGDDGEPTQTIGFDITLHDLVDLRNPKIQQNFRVRLADLTQPRTAPQAYSHTQRIGRNVYNNGLSGILFPSAYDPEGKKDGWFNLVIYPANLIHSQIRQVRSH